MWCVFDGGNLDGQMLEVEEQEIVTQFESTMCSPEQPVELVRSHGRCVYADSGRWRQTGGARSARVFVHHADWRSYSPVGAEG